MDVRRQPDEMKRTCNDDMGWFNEQIETRLRKDEERFTGAFADLAAVVMGRAASAAALDEAQKAVNAVGEILRYYHVKAEEPPEDIKDFNNLLEFLLRPSGIMRRTVKLRSGWYKDAVGPLLGRTKAGDPVALMPRILRGYDYYDWTLGKRVRVTRETAEELEEEAVCFYRPLPLKRLGIPDLLRFIVGSLAPADYLMVLAVTAATTLLGAIMPKINQYLFGSIIPSGQPSILSALACMMVGVIIARSLCNVTKNLIMNRVQTKMSLAVESASIARVLSLPAAFFKNYTAGELSSRTQQIGSLCSMLADACLSTGLTSMFSLVYLAQIFDFAPTLVLPAIGTTLASIAFSLLNTFLNMRISRRTMQQGAKNSGLIYALFTGVQKIKLAGAERRAFAQWAEAYSKQAELIYNPPLIIKLSPVIASMISLVGGVVLYFIAGASGVSAANYMAFNASYGMVAGGITALGNTVTTMARIRPTLEMVEPILKAEPEVAQGKPVLTRLSGSIELSHVTFRYSEDLPPVIDDLSLKIRPGQYIAIVGSTGCGKSTLMRLLLGFETPQKGAVYYDGKDIEKVDLKSLRQHIGVVMQDGKLLQGDVYSNIIISAPWLTEEDAWEAAELAGIADDIRAMPMGMNTIISEGGGGISGGQKQRLMIARAIAPKPKILMFDEATSALDNITQKQVSHSLDQLKSTRIVIAHRLSTIRQCDRIMVLDKGRVTEDGSYDELIAAGGYFAQLVARQRLDDEGFVGKTTVF